MTRAAWGRLLTASSISPARIRLHLLFAKVELRRSQILPLGRREVSFVVGNPRSSSMDYGTFLQGIVAMR
jgi:hypothetical protein